MKAANEEQRRQHHNQPGQTTPAPAPAAKAKDSSLSADSTPTSPLPPYSVLCCPFRLSSLACL